jgi:hypothetical protein
LKQDRIFPKPKPEVTKVRESGVEKEWDAEELEDAVEHFFAMEEL